MYYILNGETPVPCNDVRAWSEWFETADRHVAKDEVIHGCIVSTVFLGLDHSFAHTGKAPILFETMIFGGAHDELQRRYRSWQEAAAGHQEIVAVLRIWYATLRQEVSETVDSNQEI